MAWIRKRKPLRKFAGVGWAQRQEKEVDMMANAPPQSSKAHKARMARFLGSCTFCRASTDARSKMQAKRKAKVIEFVDHCTSDLQLL